MTDQISLSVQGLNGVVRQFSSVAALLDFCREETDFWKAVGERFAKSQILQGSQYLNPAIGATNIFGELLSTVQGWFPTPDGREEVEYFMSRRQELNRILSQTPIRWVPSSEVFVESWLDSYKLSVGAGDAFFNAVVHKRSDITNGSMDSVKGVILAYEFLMQDESGLRRRRGAEEKSFEKLRNKLSESKDSLLGEVDGFKKDFHEWYEKVKADDVEWRENRQADLNSSLNRNASDFLEAMKGWESKIVNLEDTYQEKLRFSGPAKYWKKKAHEYRCQGIAWTMAVIAAIAFAVVYFRELFLTWANGERLPLNLSSLEGAVIFAAILSSFIFLTRIFSRLAFSSFHLQRDAEEREQLTHLYLALGRQGQIDSESRQIVLQALFSRSETGLLASESGPTMPGLQEAISAAAKKS